MPTRLALALAAASAIALACPGCQEKFSRQHYETIHVSMPDWEVRQVLGQPDEQSGDQWTYRHDRPYYSARVSFKNGAVTGKSWSAEQPSSRPG